MPTAAEKLKADLNAFVNTVGNRLAATDKALTGAEAELADGGVGAATVILALTVRRDTYTEVMELFLSAVDGSINDRQGNVDDDVTAEVASSP
jgi:hypothetical protein